MSHTNKNKEISDFVSKDGKLRSFVQRWTKNREDTEDILQDAYYNLLRAMEITSNPVENISAWLFRSVKNLLINFGRKHKEEYKEETDKISGIVSDENDNQEKIIFRALIMQELENALALLPEAQREAFILTEIHDLTVKQAAAIQGVSINTLLSRKHYAVKHLRLRMEYLYDELND